jgi:hypothetical protein
MKSPAFNDNCYFVAVFTVARFKLYNIENCCSLCNFVKDIGDKDSKEDVRGCIQKFPDWVDNEINNKNNKLSLRSNAKDYGGKTH